MTQATFEFAGAVEPSASATSDLRAGMRSAFERAANRELLKYTAGRLITCPDCGNVLDWRRATIGSLYRTVDGAEELVQTWSLCGRCFDRTLGRVTAAMARACVEHPELNPRLEVVDGREVSKRA